MSRSSILNYSKTTRKHTVYRRFGFTSETFIRTDFRCRSSVCKSLSHTWLSWQLPSSRFMFSVFLIHIASLICLPSLSDSRSITKLYNKMHSSLNEWSLDITLFASHQISNETEQSKTITACSHHRHVPDKTILSCLCRRCEQN